MPKFKLVSEYKPQGDQPQAIKKISRNVIKNVPYQTLLGVTGSGKTFTMANVIARVEKPTLVIAHNKTLAAQLYNEFKQFFPENAVEYFVSYYDYYQPEAYLPITDTYIEKDSAINDVIDKMRHSATRSLIERRDVIIVASVSCIYGLGSPEAYYGMLLDLKKGEMKTREKILANLVEIQYERNDLDFHRGTFRVRGDVIEIFPAYESEEAIRLSLFDEEIESITGVDPLTGDILRHLDKVVIYPKSHYVTPRQTLLTAMVKIKEELKERTAFFEKENKLVEAQRIEQRTMFDLEMIQEIGYCKGIENYSRYLSGRKAGEPPPTLLDYFPADALIIVDESHVTIPQVRGMYEGDRSRKTMLVNYGFRLPSALDNRPLNFKEFEQIVRQVVFVSATPADYEKNKSGKNIIEQIIRPTGLIDPPITIRPVKGQVDDLLKEIQIRADRQERVLVTTLTKRFAEDLTDFYLEKGIKVKYLHSDIDTLERVEIIRSLRLGDFDCLIGINLLREGLDIPEVSLVAILDADKEGFLRSETSLIQTSGRAARHLAGEVIMYADRITGSIKRAKQETERRRLIQEEYNRKNKITPTSIKKSIHEIMGSVPEADYFNVSIVKEDAELYSTKKIENLIVSLEKEMRQAAKEMRFEQAAQIRDRIRKLKERELELSFFPKK